MIAGHAGETGTTASAPPGRARVCGAASPTGSGRSWSGAAAGRIASLGGFLG